MSDWQGQFTRGYFHGDDKIVGEMVFGFEEEKEAEGYL